MFTYANAKAEFRLTSDGDDWGNVLGWWFHVADEIYWNRDFPVPEEWEFRASPIGPQNEPDEYETEVVRNMSDDDLAHFGAVLNRYARFLKHCGKDY